MDEPLQDDLAGLDARAPAQIIDNLLNVILIYGSFLFTLADATIGALFILVGIAIAIGHYLLAEAFWDGRTIGKHLMNIKVVKKDGSPCTIGRSLIRNILQIIDVLPTLWIIGIISISATEYNQRIGDLVAGTIVVKDGTNN